MAVCLIPGLITAVKKIKIKVNRRFDVSNIILKIEVVYANVKEKVEDFEHLGQNLDKFVLITKNPSNCCH